MIRSRTPNDPLVLWFKALIYRASQGTIGDPSQGALVPMADTLYELKAQTDTLCNALNQTLDELTGQVIDTERREQELLNELQALRHLTLKLLRVDNDHTLDNAAADLIECFSSSRAAEVTSDGSLAFDERVSFTKEDLKPIIKEVIERWVATRGT